MAKRIKQFFVFLFFSLFFSLLSNRVTAPQRGDENNNKNEVKNKYFSFNSAQAGTCCPKDDPYCP